MIIFLVFLLVVWEPLDLIWLFGIPVDHLNLLRLERHPGIEMNARLDKQIRIDACLQPVVQPLALGGSRVK